jgi:NADH:ubiquinone oxidoreductase subunit 5 (subunit L)/multisubunit Na+/H+ antiporter MnhA subunit
LRILGIFHSDELGVPMNWLFDHTKLATFITIMVMLTIIAGGILVVSQRDIKED